MITQFFKSFEIFADDEIADFIPLFDVKILEKNDFFIKEHQFCKEIAFINSGVFRSFYTSSEGNETTYCFRFPNDLMVAYSSFITGNPSLENLQAISKAELLVIQKRDFDKLTHQNHSWTLFLKLVAEQEYVQMEQRVFQLQKDNAQQRYHTLLKNQPEYLQQIPLQYLASYLGITQRHLSRIRK